RQEPGREPTPGGKPASPTDPPAGRQGTRRAQERASGGQEAGRARPRNGPFGTRERPAANSVNEDLGGDASDPQGDRNDQEEPIRRKRRITRFSGEPEATASAAVASGSPLNGKNQSVISVYGHGAGSMVADIDPLQRGMSGSGPNAWI